MNEVRLSQLEGGNVHGHFDVVRPFLRLFTGSLQNPGPQFAYETCLFRQRNKAVRRDKSELGMAPADQCFERAGGSTTQVDDWLKMQFEFASLYRGSELDCQGMLTLTSHVHALFEKGKCSATHGFRAVKSKVGVLQNVLRGHTMDAHRGYADAGPDLDLLIAYRHWLR